jgi:hypothetical protein
MQKLWASHITNAAIFWILSMGQHVMSQRAYIQNYNEK